MSFLFLWKNTDGTHLSALTNSFSMQVERIQVIDINPRLLEETKWYHRSNIGQSLSDVASLEGMTFADEESWEKVDRFLVETLLNRTSLLPGPHDKNALVFVLGTIKVTLKQAERVKLAKPVSAKASTTQSVEGGETEASEIHGEDDHE